MTHKIERLLRAIIIKIANLYARIAVDLWQAAGIETTEAIQMTADDIGSKQRIIKAPDVRLTAQRVAAIHRLEIYTARRN